MIGARTSMEVPRRLKAPGGKFAAPRARSGATNPP